MALAARAGDAPALARLLDSRPGLANLPAPDDAALAAPLHHLAARGDAAGCAALLRRGAWRGLRDAAGRTPAEVAADPALAARLRPPAAPPGLPSVEARFHALIRRRMAEFGVELPLRLPQLAPLLEVPGQWWFRVPGMYGGFAYALHPGPILRAGSWCRVVGGSEQEHEITPRATRLAAGGD